jgi:hypothetical protein
MPRKTVGVGEPVGRDYSDLTVEVGGLESAVGFLPLRQRSEVFIVRRKHRINGIRACQDETRTLEAQLLPISVHVVISGNAEDAFLRHPGDTSQLVKEVLDQLVFFLLAGEREVARCEDEVEIQALAASLKYRIRHSTQDNILRPLIALPHVDVGDM